MKNLNKVRKCKQFIAMVTRREEALTEKELELEKKAK
jgi:hypothetical protein